jgi:hypothetical protein
MIAPRTPLRTINAPNNTNRAPAGNANGPVDKRLQMLKRAGSSGGPQVLGQRFVLAPSPVRSMMHVPRSPMQGRTPDDVRRLAKKSSSLVVHSDENNAVGSNSNNFALPSLSTTCSEMPMHPKAFVFAPPGISSIKSPTRVSEAAPIASASSPSSTSTSTTMQCSPKSSDTIGTAQSPSPVRHLLAPPTAVEVSMPNQLLFSGPASRQMAAPAELPNEHSVVGQQQQQQDATLCSNASSTQQAPPSWLAGLTPEQEAARQQRIQEANERRARLEEAKKKRMDREAAIAEEAARVASEAAERRARGMEVVDGIACARVEGGSDAGELGDEGEVEGEFVAFVQGLSMIAAPPLGWPSVDELDESLRGVGGIMDGGGVLCTVHRHLLAACRGEGGSSGRGSWVRELEEWAEYEMGERSPFNNIKGGYSRLCYRSRVELLHELVCAAMEAKAAGREPESMRCAPVGMDASGARYWHVATGAPNAWVAKEDGEGMSLSCKDVPGLERLMKGMALAGDTDVAVELALGVYLPCKSQAELEARKGSLRRGQRRAPARLAESAD